MYNEHSFLKKILLEEIEKQQEIIKKRMVDDADPSYEKMEYECKTTVTDEDMLKMQINHALDIGDKESFIKLTNELNKLKIEVAHA
ncbi:IDEAL domain-containing protein [Gracilibacillus thailandensis]|nr:IDEAL domain-containing protein [Gracilibacillus thailandensis]